MSIKLSQRQLDALREDAIEEGRSRQRHEDIQRNIERFQARMRWVGPIGFARWIDAREGTVLLATDDGSSFYKYARIERVVGSGQETGRGVVRDGYLWIEYTLLPKLSTGGSTVQPDERIMVIPSTVR